MLQYLWEDLVSFWGNTKDTTRSVAMDRKFQSLPRAQPSPDEENSRFKSDAFRCRTVVCSIKSGPRKHSQTPYLFRSYSLSSRSLVPLERNPDDINSFEIWQVACATAAAPSYFKPIKLLDTEYSDASLSTNNPSLEMVMQRIFKETENLDDGRSRRSQS